MKKKTALTGTLLLFLLFSATAQTRQTRALKRAIICLTYDEGLITQLTTALPQLDSFELKAPFFLPPIQGSSQSETIGQTPEAVLGWTNAARHGHELANPTLFLPCPVSIGWDKAVAIDGYTFDKLVTEVTTQNILLSLLDPGRRKRAFAFHYGNAFIGTINYAHVLKEKALITFARTGGDSNSVITDFNRLYRYASA